jgi:hypothetical protein
LTSGSLEALKHLIKQVLDEREALYHAVPRTRAELEKAKRRLQRAEHWLFGIFLRKQVPERRAAVEATTAKLQHLEERLSGAFIDAEFALDDQTRAAFEQVTQAFEALTRCARTWNVTSFRPNDRKVTRSAATCSVERAPVRFTISDDPVLRTEGKVLKLANAEDADLLVYPGFVFMQSRGDLALVDLREIKVTYRPSRFIEEEPVPHDAVVVDYTWAKCNKDGSPDRRFANNRRIPIASYGELTLESESGLNEQYQFSSADKAAHFAESLADYQIKLRLLGDRDPGERRPALPDGTPAPPPSPRADRYHLKSIAFLQAASAISPTHAIDAVRKFGALLKEEVDALSGDNSCQDLETLVNELARVPSEVRSFVRKTIPKPVVNDIEKKLLHGIKVLVGSIYKQLRTAIEQIEPKSKGHQRLLRLVCEAEEVLQR